MPADVSDTRFAKAEITALILAGGQGSRLGGVDKGWLPYAGHALIEHVLVAIAPQVGSVLISANRNRERYQSLGVPVVPDLYEGQLGPLAGMLAGLTASDTPFVLTLPCDTPEVCEDFVVRMWKGLHDADAEIAMANDGERNQPVHALLRRHLRADLDVAVRDGQRSVQRWAEGHRWVAVDFSDRASAFRGINTPEDYAVCGVDKSG